MKLSTLLLLVDLMMMLFFGLSGQLAIYNCKDPYRVLLNAIVTIGFIIFFGVFGISGIVRMVAKKEGKNIDKIEV